MCIPVKWSAIFLVATMTTTWTGSGATPESVVSANAERWAIEETHRSCKQFFGAEDPRYWHPQ